MAELPEVVLKEIFDFLGVRERLRVRSTCKKWKFVADNLSHQTSVCLYSSNPFNKRWCFSKQKVTDDEMLYLKFTREASRPFDFRMEFFRNLRKVYLYSVSNQADRFLEEVNQLTRLKVLIIDDVRIDKFRTLNSPTLEKFALKNCNFNHLRLNTPNLSSLVLWNDIHFREDREDRNRQHVEFRFPLKVKHLQCTEFRPNLRQLKNLQTLACHTIAFEFQLNDFESLTRAELWSLEAFRMVQNEKRRLRRTKLQLFASGFDEETVTREPLEDQDQFFCSPMSTIFKGVLPLSRQFLEKAESNQWNLTDPVLWHFILDLNVLGSLPGRIPKEFFEKFRIRTISYLLLPYLLRAEIDQSALVDLVERCNPSKLMFDPPLSKDILQRLSSIQSIKLLEVHCDVENANFLLNLKNLGYLEIQSATISIDFVCRMYKELKYLFGFNFYSREFKPFNLHARFFFRPEERDGGNDAPADTLYSLSYRYGSLVEKNAISRCMYFKSLDEFIEQAKILKENEMIASYFV